MHGAEVLEVVHFLYPVLLLGVFLTAFIAQGVISAKCAFPQRPKLTGPGGKPLPQTQLSKEQRERLKQNNFSRNQTLLFCWLAIAQIFTFLANAANVIVHALSERNNGGWWCGQATVVYLVASTFLYALFLISLVDTSPAPTWAHLVTWTVALVGEAILFAVSAHIYSSPHQEYDSLKPRELEADYTASQWEIFEISVDGLRIVLLLAAIAFYLVFSKKQRSHARRCEAQAGTPNERTPLLLAQDGDVNRPLSNGHRGTPDNAEEDNISDAETNAHSSNHHTPTNSNSVNGHAVNHQSPGGDGHNDRRSAAKDHGDDAESLHERAAFYRPTTAPVRSWWEYLYSYSLFFPYLWPSKSLKLKIIVLICFFLTGLQRLVNLLVPMQIAVVTMKFEEGSGQIPWKEVSLLVFYKFLQGSSGVLGATRSMLWIPISQFSYQALATAGFEHVHNLSLDFHLSKRTGEVISALNKGSSINTFLEQITFNVIPMLVDLFLAIIYFQIKFDAYFSLVFAVVTFWYLYLTVRMAQWRAVQRRVMANADREEEAVKNDSLHSYETVKYFNAEAYEVNRYKETVKNYQKAEYQVLRSLNVMNITQNMVFMLGLLVTSFICAWQVTNGSRDVGDFVQLLVYMQQLQSPLNFFGTFYRTVQSAMISGERLLELFKEQPSVTDDPSALDLHHCDGNIEFDNLRFAYSKHKPALNGLSFKCPAGTTTALVGESGGGKSTIFRLMFRFYNPEDGSIRVDGHDVRTLTIDSVRKHIGVVPQETILFNETLMWNLRYANQKATDEEIFAACRAASIHDRILSEFPHGYDTKVGERGMKLSGGEKQRVAIARTILKNPRIIMLDEATAALDTETEEHIQEALKLLSNGRTMLMIAHRLSTITHADQILVLHNGAVAESGTHQELLQMKGRYASMWRRQIRAEQAATEAKIATDRAVALQKKATSSTRPNSSGEGGDSGNVSESDGEILIVPNNTPEKVRKTPSAMSPADSLRIAAALQRTQSSEDTQRFGQN